jgi:hypothetical protein
VSGGRVNLRADEAAVGDGAAHAGDEDHAAGALEADHLAGNCLGGHEDAGDVDAEHAVAVLGGVVQGRGLLLDAGGGEEAVDAAVLVGDTLDEGVEVGLLADIGAVVGDGGVELGLCAGGDTGKVLTGLLQAVDDVNDGTGLEEALGLGETETTAAAGDDDDLALEAELGEAPVDGGNGADGTHCVWFLGVRGGVEEARG